MIIDLILGCIGIVVGYNLYVFVRDYDEVMADIRKLKDDDDVFFK